MDINQIKQLIKLVEKSEIADFSIHEGDLKIKISKNSRNHVVTNLPIATQQQSEPVAAPVVKEMPAAAEKTPDNHYEIKSPIVGTFYRAPAPDADPYIQIGDQISEGSVLCIVEAMKLMNEIESDVNGKIIKILVENATPVEFNQPLFLIERS